MQHKRIISLLLVAAAILGRPSFWWQDSTSTRLKEKSTIYHKVAEDPYSLDLSRFFQEYVDFHNQLNEQEDAKYLFWRCGDGCGGTGDRIKGIISTFYTAICSRRIFLIDWPDTTGHPLDYYLSPNRINWQVRSNNIDLTTSKVIGKFKRMHGYSSPVLKNLQIPSRLANESILAMMTNRWYQDEMSDKHWYGGSHNSSWYPMNSSPCLQKWRKEEETALLHENPLLADNHILFRSAFDELFQFSEKVKRQAQLIQTSAGLNHQYLAMHVRTGGAFDDPGRHTSQDEYDKFYQCAKRLQGLIQERQCKDEEALPIYVASDDENVKQLFLSMDTEQSFRTLPGLTLYHIDKPHLAADTQTAEEGELIVWAELLVLQQATCLITSTSGYSQLATWLQESRCAIHFEDCQSTAHVTKALEGIGCAG